MNLKEIKSELAGLVADCDQLESIILNGIKSWTSEDRKNFVDLLQKETDDAQDNGDRIAVLIRYCASLGWAQIISAHMNKQLFESEEG